ncbi:MAG: hypothetical protein VYE68_11820 [Acidobacteriota bacterium]|nr:hypothetical protein [Acidobacteriota bacterium]
MIYRVTAHLLAEKAPELWSRLQDGSIAEQRPDGQEIVDSLQRAVVGDDGAVMWSEQCFCGTPRAHERATVLDHYFADLTTEEIPAYTLYEGRPFLEYLEGNADHDAVYPRDTGLSRRGL